MKKSIQSIQSPSLRTLALTVAAIAAMTAMMALILVGCNDSGVESSNSKKAEEFLSRFGGTGDDPTPTHTHVWGEWTVTTPATATTSGVETRVCTIDQSHIDTRTIPATGVTPTTYTLSTAASPTNGGTTSPATPQSGITAGTAVNISATASSNYTFSSWTVTSGTAAIASSNSANTTVTLSSNATVTANFTATPVVNPPDGSGDDLVYGGQTYKTVIISGTRWMAENLNVATANSWCYEDDESNCTKYGRLYTYTAAKSACQGMGDGWRLPDTADWNRLVDYADGEYTAGKKLKAKSGWIGWAGGNGTDDYEFSALPGGARNSDRSFSYVGYIGYWWSATTDTESGGGYAYLRGMRSYDDSAYEYSLSMDSGFAVRCSQ